MIQNINCLHPWHGIQPSWNGKSLIGVIEIPQGSRIKYEIDKESGLIKMDRLLSSSFEYPINYGFIPRTLGEDGDPLDILVMTHSPLVPLCLVECRVLGLMQMIDRGIKDDKILAIANTDVTLAHVQSLNDFPPHFFAELKNFFEEYTKLENKRVEIHEFLDFNLAVESIENHISLYKDNFMSI
ncbi:MAG: inorganic diphosphatase [Saprospiraceae bacterium]